MLATVIIYNHIYLPVQYCMKCALWMSAEFLSYLADKGVQFEAVSYKKFWITLKDFVGIDNYVTLYLTLYGLLCQHR